MTRPDPTQSRATAVTDTRPSRARRRPRPGGAPRPGRRRAHARARAPGPSREPEPERRAGPPAGRAVWPTDTPSGSPLVVLGRAPARGVRRDSGCLGTRRSPLPPPRLVVSVRLRARCDLSDTTDITTLTRGGPASCVPSPPPVRRPRTRRAHAARTLETRETRLAVSRLPARLSSLVNQKRDSPLLAGRGDPSALCVTFNII